MEEAQWDTPPHRIFHQHVLIEGHDGLVNDCEITLIDKTDSLDPTRWEFFLDKTPQDILPSCS